MIDIVVPYVLSSFGSEELRFALRSWHKHFTNIGNVFLVGDVPNWINVQTVYQVKHERGDGMRGRERNIYEKVLAACNNIAVSDPFLFANDDHFMQCDYDLETFPNLYWGNIGTVKTSNAPYQCTLNNTIEILSHQARYFDGHAPMLINKQLFIKAHSIPDWQKHWGYCIKTMYGAALDESQVAEANHQQWDVKCHTLKEIQSVEANEFFSTTDGCLHTPGAMSYMHNLYPDKSPYEL